MLKIFLSSTYRDLAEYRSEILDKLNTAFNGVGMEQFVPDGSNSQEVCISYLKKADVVIFLISPYYGSLMDTCSLKEECKAECTMKTKTGKISYTHCEYKTTIAEGILHQTYLVGTGWDDPKVKKEALQFRDEIGKEYLGFVDMEDPQLIRHMCNNLATKLVEWHTSDKLNFNKFIDREEELNEIIDNIDGKVEVWGVGGVGKTALIEVALLVEKLKGKKIATIGTSKSYKSGSGFNPFRKKCVDDQYITESPKSITLYDVVKALEKVKLIPNAEDLIKSLQQKDKIRSYLSKFLNENKNLILFIDDFHLATENVENLVDSLETIILSSRKNSNIARKEICIVGIDEENREELIKLFNPNIPEKAKAMIKTIAEGHPVATELLVKNYGKIDFDKIKDFELIDANDKQVKDFYERVIEEIFSGNPQALMLLKDLALINTDLPTNINRESVLNSYNIEDVRKIFNSLVDTGMLKKREGEEGTYEFYFKHIQDVLEDIGTQENHKKAINYYGKKREIIGENIDDRVEILSHSLAILGEFRKKNHTEELVNEFLDIKKKIQPIHYGFTRFIDVGVELKALVDEKSKAPILVTLGNLYADLNRFEEAEPAYVEALEIYRTLAGKNPETYNVNVATTQNNLGILYMNLKRFEEAESAYIEALKIRKELAGKNPEAYNVDVAMTQNNLGILYRQVGRYEEAESAYTEALEIRKELAGKNPEDYNADVAMTQNNLGALYWVLKRFEEAEPAYVEALEIYRALAGKNPETYNADVATTQNNLGILFKNLKRFEEAESASTETLEIYRALAGKNPEAYNASVANTQIILGILYLELKRFEEAETTNIEAMEIYRALACKNPEIYNASVAMTQNNLGILYMNLKRFEEAETAYLEALEIRKELAGKNPKAYNVSVAESQDNIGILYKNLKRFEEAETANIEALEIRKELADKNPEAYNTSVAKSQNNLGVLYADLKRFEEAEPAYIEVLKIYRALASKNPEVYNADIATTQNNLGTLYWELKRFAEAESAYTEALEIGKELAVKNPEVYNASVADTQNNLGVLYIALEKYDNAMECLNKVLEIDPDYGGAWYNKACLESLRDNQEKAVEFLKKAIDLDKKYIGMAKTDEDFDNLKDLQEFKELIEN
ncbi:MAG: tetratricopeptide repeat protein [Promethearchaeota archaeon]